MRKRVPFSSVAVGASADDGPLRPAAGTFDLQGKLDAVMPLRYTPTGIVVNAELDILRFLGNITPYLRPVAGRSRMNLNRMASGDVLQGLRRAVDASRETARPVTREMRLSAPGAPVRRARVEILPLKADRLRKDYFLMLFVELSAVDEFPSGAGRSGKERRGQLKSAIATLKASNESLLLSNDELRSTNDRFDTIKDELRATNEELQATNEELTTSTEEVVRGSEILRRANNDLSNLLANVNIPIVLLDPDLTVHRFTPAAEKVLGLSARMIGRSIFDVRLPLRLPGLKRLLCAVIKTGSVQKLEVQDYHGRWYDLLIRPYRTAKSTRGKSRTDGAVLALVDVHERKLAEKILSRLATVVLDSNDAVIICDLKDRIIAWNKGAQKMYGYGEAEALGMSIKLLMPEKKVIRARELVKVSAAQIETQRRARSGRILDVLLTVTVLRDGKGEPVEVATTERDITEFRRAERELRRLHARVDSAQETERKRLARELHDGVGQILSGVKFRLQALPGKMTLSEGAEAKILKVGGFLDHAIAEIRRVSQNLMPAELVDLGLEAALQTLCREFKERSGVKATVTTVPTGASPELGLALFRIAQEALNNIGKHSKATTASVALSREGKSIALIVSDNGTGFKPGAGRSASGRGLGLGNMRQRAESVGGSFEVRSSRGAGTALTIRVPLSGLGGSAS